MPYTAFASKKGQAVTARLVVRRVRDLNKHAAGGMDELFPVWRYHAVFTGSPFELIQAEGQHRDYLLTELRDVFPLFRGHGRPRSVTVRGHAGTEGSAA